MGRATGEAYLRKSVVQKLYAQQTYVWGWQSVALLAQKVIQKQSPGGHSVFSADSGNGDERG